MNIGIDASRVNIGKKTGVEYYSTALLHWFKKIDASANSEGDLQHAKYTLYVQDSNDIEFTDLPKNFHIRRLYSPFFWTQIRLAGELLFSKNKPKRLFIPSNAIPFFLALFDKKIKKVVTIHDVAFKHIPDSYSFIARFYLNLSVLFAVKFSEKIVTDSKSSKEDLVAYYGCDPDKIEVTYLGFTPPAEMGEEWEGGNWEEVQKKYKIDKPYLVFVGRLESKKNILGLIKSYYEVLSSGYDLQLVLVGKKGVGWNEAEEFIKKYNLDDRVIVTGYVKEWEKNTLLKNAQALVFISKYEGFGLPVLEAFYAGIPVVVSQIPVFEELFSNTCVFVDPENPKEIADSVIKLLKSPIKRLALVRKGKERLKNFSWEKCARETLEIIKSL